MDKKKILVVDDEENIRSYYKEELEDAGYEVMVAENAQEAAKKFQEFSPDLITLDIKMPEIDGIEFLRKLREKDKNIPVVINSAYSSFKQDFQVWAADAYVTKSSNLTELLNVISNILKKERGE